MCGGDTLPSRILRKEKNDDKKMALAKGGFRWCKFIKHQKITSDKVDVVKSKDIKENFKTGSKDIEEKSKIGSDGSKAAC